VWNKVLTDLVFIEPRQIQFELPEGGKIGNLILNENLPDVFFLLPPA
jgi:hypothetical protein